MLFLKGTSMFLLTPKVRDPGLSNQLLKVTPTHPALSLLAAVIASHTDSLAPRKPHEIPTPSTPGLVSEERGGSSWGWQGTEVCLGEMDGSPGHPQPLGQTTAVASFSSLHLPSQLLLGKPESFLARTYKPCRDLAPPTSTVSPWTTAPPLILLQPLLQQTRTFLPRHCALSAPSAWNTLP